MTATTYVLHHEPGTDPVEAALRVSGLPPLARELIQQALAVDIAEEAAVDRRGPPPRDRARRRHAMALTGRAR